MNNENETSKNQGTDAGEKSEPRVGVYICHCGGNISDHVDVEKLAESIKDIPHVSKVHTNTFMCSDPGQELIQEDIKNKEINRVVVASCAPSLHETTFRNAIKRADMNPYLYEHANIREQVSWVHHGEPATEKAGILVSAAIAKAAELETLEPIQVDARKHVTVIGAGIAGMKAAADLARQGFEVALVEISPFLGGQTARLGSLYPSSENAADLIRELYEQLFGQEKVSVYSCAQVADFKGFIGNFELTLTRAELKPSSRESLEQAKQQNARPGDYVENSGIYMPVSSVDGTMEIQTGAVVMATGFKTYTPARGELGFGEQEPVVTLQQFIMDAKQADSRDGVLFLKGRKIRRIAFIHCVGSRQIPGIHEPDENGNLNEYCSRTCCSAVIQAACQIREKYPETDVFDFYRDIRTYGRFQEDLYDRASESRVMFFRFEPDSPPMVSPSKGDAFPLNIRVKDVLTFNEEVEAEVDMIVLATGMVPRPIKDMVDMMKLPVGADRFLQEVHPKLRPVEVANTGILLAGTCQAPMDITEACAAAGAASVKTSVLLKKGYVELDPFVAEVRKDQCKGHGQCKEACPVDSAIEIEGGLARVNPALCTGCGICTAVCPENAIDVKGWSLHQYVRMVDAILAA